MISDHYVRNLDKYKGQRNRIIITEFNPRRRRIIGNRKILIQQEKEEMKEVLFDKIEVGMKYKGTVKNIVNFGAFIDLGGADGLLHISEMSWGRVDNPKDICKIGEEIEVLIKEINGDRIALSLKFDETNPWLDAERNIVQVQLLQSNIARMTEFGAFVELEPGVDSLLHVSQISKEHIEKPSDVLSIGEKITAKVVDLNIEDQKISLSIKAMDDIETDETEEVDVKVEAAQIEEEVAEEAEEAVEEVAEEVAEVVEETEEVEEADEAEVDETEEAEVDETEEA